MDYLTSADGLKLRIQSHKAEKEKARLMIVHGLGEHCETFGNVIAAVQPEGYSVWTFDLRGHGQSDGPRGHINRFEDYLSDVRICLEHMKHDSPAGQPVYLMGDSLGGLIVVRFALAFPDMIDGVIASAPGIGQAAVSPAKKVVGKLISGIFPRLTVGNGLDFSTACHDENWLRHHAEDPLIHDRVTARFFTEFSRTQAFVQKEAHNLSVPLLMQLAKEDHFIDARDSTAFFNNAGVKDKTLHVYDHLFHYVYFEPPEMRAQVQADLLAWLDRHTDNA